MTTQKKSNEWFRMETAMLECSIAEGIKLDSLYLFESKVNKGTYYIVDKESYRNKDQRTKVWFKKTFIAFRRVK